MQQPAIAVITPNSLMGLGLKTLLGELLPAAEISVFHRFAAFEESGPERYVHYFVAMQTFLRHSAFFQERPRQTILLGHGRSTQFAEMHRLDVCASEERIVRDILRLRRDARRPEHRIDPQGPPPDVLSARETEVLSLVARGLMNKEIADRLHIGTTTVISHRRNIMEKLGIKSVAGLTLYAATLGYVDADDL